MEMELHLVQMAITRGKPELNRAKVQALIASLKPATPAMIVLPELFSTRDVYFKGWSGLDSPERVRRALDFLEDAAWVCKAEPPTSPSGGRPSEAWIVNPKVTHAK